MPSLSIALRPATGPAQVALAGRPHLPVTVAGLLAETAGADALVTLAGNRTAPLSEVSIRRMIERHGEDAEVREALLGRLDLPMSARVDLAAATMRAMACFVADRNWMSEARLQRVGREARNRAAIAISDSTRGWAGALELVRHLRDSGDLTLSLVFRAILSGKIELFKAALSVLADVALTRVDGIVDRFDASAFAGLYRKAGLPEALLPAIRIALLAVREADWSSLRSASLSCLVIERVLTGCDAINKGDLDTLMVLLRRFEAEARREATRGAGWLPHDGALRLDRERFDNAPLLLEDLDMAVPKLAPASRQEPRQGAAQRAADVHRRPRRDRGGAAGGLIDHSFPIVQSQDRYRRDAFSKPCRRRDAGDRARARLANDRHASLLLRGQGRHRYRRGIGDRLGAG